MIATSNAGALVKGAPASQAKLVKLTVTRAFCIAGVRQELGATVEVTEALGRELASMGKVIAYVEKAKAKPEPKPPAAEKAADGPDPKDEKPSEEKPGDDKSVEAKVPRGQEKSK